MRICLLVSGLVALAGLMALTAEAQPVSSAPRGREGQRVESRAVAGS